MREEYTLDFLYSLRTLVLNELDADKIINEFATLKSQKVYI